MELPLGWSQLWVDWGVDEEDEHCLALLPVTPEGLVLDARPTLEETLEQVGWQALLAWCAFISGMSTRRLQ